MVIYFLLSFSITHFSDLGRQAVNVAFDTSVYCQHFFMPLDVFHDAGHEGVKSDKCLFLFQFTLFSCHFHVSESEDERAFLSLTLCHFLIT